MWLPALGAALFVSVALWWAVTPAAVPVVIAADTAPSASASAPAPAASASALAAPPQPQPAHSALPLPGTRPLPTLQGVPVPSGAPGSQGGIHPRRLRDPAHPQGPGGQR